jgi:hypothetical protein
MSGGHNDAPDAEPPGRGSADVLANEPRTRRRGRLIAWSTVGVLAVAALAGGGYAATRAGSGSGPADVGAAAQAAVAAATPSASPSGPASRPGPHPGRFGLPGDLGLGRVLHGEATVTTANGGTRLVDVQTGSITAKDGDTVTVTSTDKVAFSYVVDAKTRIVDYGVAKPRQATIADVKVGDTVRIVATRSGETRTATSITAGQPTARPGVHPTPGSGDRTTPQQGDHAKQRAGTRANA